MNGSNGLDFDALKGFRGYPKQVTVIPSVGSYGGFSIEKKEFKGTDNLMEEKSKSYDPEDTKPDSVITQILDGFPGLTEEKLNDLLRNYDIESMDSDELFKLADKLIKEEIIPPRPDENGLNQIAVFPRALYDALLQGDTSLLGGIVHAASGINYIVDQSTGEPGFALPEYGLERLRYEQQMLEQSYSRFSQYYTDDELKRHIQLANSKARFLELAEQLVKV